MELDRDDSIIRRRLQQKLELVSQNMADLMQPTDEEMRATASQGVLHGVLDKLRADAASPEPAVRQVAERAILLLYQIAKG